MKSVPSLAEGSDDPIHSHSKVESLPLILLDHAARTEEEHWLQCGQTAHIFV